MAKSNSSTQPNADRVRDLFSKIACLAGSLDDLSQDVLSDLSGAGIYSEKITAMRSLVLQAGALADMGAEETNGIPWREDTDAWLLSR